jgi:hypothetical protein
MKEQKLFLDAGANSMLTKNQDANRTALNNALTG